MHLNDPSPIQHRNEITSCYTHIESSVREVPVMSVHVKRLSSSVYEESGSRPSPGWTSNVIISSISLSDGEVENTITVWAVELPGVKDRPTSLALPTEGRGVTWPGVVGGVVVL